MGATAPELARGGLPAEDAGVGDARESPIWLAGKVVQAASEPTAGGRGGGVSLRLTLGNSPRLGAGLDSLVLCPAVSPAEPKGLQVGGAQRKDRGAEPEGTKNSSASPCPNMVPNLRPGCTIA